MKETAIGYGILIIIAIIEWEYLPAQAAITILGVPAGDRLVVDGLGEGEPLGTFCGGIGEVHFGSGDCGEAPECLVVVSLDVGLVGGHVVFVVAYLEATISGGTRGGEAAGTALR